MKTITERDVEHAFLDWSVASANADDARMEGNQQATQYWDGLADAQELIYKGLHGAYQHEKAKQLPTP